MPARRRALTAGVEGTRSRAMSATLPDVAHRAAPPPTNPVRGKPRGSFRLAASTLSGFPCRPPIAGPPAAGSPSPSALLPTLGRLPMVILTDRRRRSLARGVFFKTQSPPLVWLGRPSDTVSSVFRLVRSFVRSIPLGPGRPPVTDPPFSFLAVTARQCGCRLSAPPRVHGPWLRRTGPALTLSTEAEQPGPRGSLRPVVAPAVPSDPIASASRCARAVGPAPMVPEGITGRCGLPRSPEVDLENHTRTFRVPSTNCVSNFRVP